MQDLHCWWTISTISTHLQLATAFVQRPLRQWKQVRFRGPQAGLEATKIWNIQPFWGNNAWSMFFWYVFCRCMFPKNKQRSTFHFMMKLSCDRISISPCFQSSGPGIFDKIRGHEEGCIKPRKSWDTLLINWCRISSINSIYIRSWYMITFIIIYNYTVTFHYKAILKGFLKEAMLKRFQTLETISQANCSWWTLLPIQLYPVGQAASSHRDLM